MVLDAAIFCNHDVSFSSRLFLTMSSLYLLVNFFIENATQILQPPVDGNMILVFQLLHKWIKLNDHREQSKGINELLSITLEINLLSPRSIILDEGIESVLTTVNFPRISWIFAVKLHTLRDRILGNPFKEVSFSIKPTKVRQKDALKQLLKVLSDKNADKKACRVTERFTMEICTKFLQEPTAMVKLAKERARVATIRKPIYQVCDNEKHSKVLANICFSKKDIVNSVVRNIHLPSVNLHKIIFQYRSLILSEIFSCSQAKIHNLPIKLSSSELTLGDCSYLDTCHKIKSCRYLHYYTLSPSKNLAALTEDDGKDFSSFTIGQPYTNSFREVIPPQWISCDVNNINFNLLGKFAAIIADPAWDIHMSLPYGTCKDMELLSLPIDSLQDEGLIVLWVTGRSIEVGRKALAKWGYQMANEMIWIKLNQLKRTIVTGRTGHWLNHSKEHFLVGVKGNPQWISRLVDVDTVVSNTRETLRKPDEVYDMLERIVGKHSRKLEIFGRDHNIRPGWLTVGNQVTGTSLHEPMLRNTYDKLFKHK